MNTKNKFFALALMAMAMVFTAYSKDDDSKGKTTAAVSQPVKVADYLWEITLDDYAPSMPEKYIGQIGAEFGCSAVRNGNFYGRNLDFFINETAEVVVHVPAKEGRHASIGVASVLQKTDADLAKGLTDDEKSALAWGLYDGINDAGLVCNMNVVPYEDGGDTPGTNPGKPDILNSLLVRPLLDNCATVDEAINYLNDHNIIGKNLGGFNVHYMIADPKKNVVVEFINNKIVVQEHYIMTNYHLNMPEKTHNADGVERYAILIEHYAEGGESMQGMYNLMQRVRFSLAYDPDVKPFWKSEWHEGGKYSWDEDESVILADPNVQYQLTQYKNFIDTGEYNLKDGLWWTTHNTIYDISTKKMWVTIREQYSKKPYEFKL